MSRRYVTTQNLVLSKDIPADHACRRVGVHVELFGND
jgi:hypothetical protein